MDDKDLVFIYGEHKKGQPMEYVMDGAKLVMKNAEAKGIAMYRVSGVIAPITIETPQGTVLGEVYEVSKKKLKQLDKDFKVGSIRMRKLIPVRADEGEGPVDMAWAYFLTEFAAVLDREWPTQFEPIYEWPE